MRTSQEARYFRSGALATTRPADIISAADFSWQVGQRTSNLLDRELSTVAFRPSRSSNLLNGRPRSSNGLQRRTPAEEPDDTGFANTILVMLLSCLKHWLAGRLSAFYAT
jgi:hypothetical protein